MQSEEYEIRNYQDGDEAETVRLFNETYRKYGGFVPRTVDYWRWCCLERPDVDRKGIFLVFNKRTASLEGYAVVGASGNVWEFCSRDDKEQVASMLLQQTISYLEKAGTSSVFMNAPDDDQVLSKVCSELGFSKTKAEKMFVSSLSLKHLISAMIANKKEELGKRFEEGIAIELSETPFPVENHVSIRIHDGNIEVGEDSPPTIAIRTDFMTLLSILFGLSNPYRALFTLRMKIKPSWKAYTALKFLYSMRINDSWFYPMGDYG